MLKKVILIVLVVILVGALGAGAWWLFKGDGTSAVTPFDKLIGNGSEVESTELADVYKHSESKVCDYDATLPDGATTKSIIYLSNGRSYAVTEGIIEGAPKTYVLFKDDATYSWSEGSTQGTKVSQSADQMQALVKAQQESGEGTSGVKTTIVCKDWTVDESLFTPPANVTFDEIVNPNS